MSSVARDAGEGGPLISVVMPTRNRAGLLPRAIRSVLEQTLAELELIVVDDGSTDPTPQVVETFAVADRRIRTLRLDASRGAATARNHGVQAARAPFVAFIDDDSEYLPTKLERQIAALNRVDAGVGLVYCPTVYVRADGRERVVGSCEADGDRARAALLRRNFIDTSAVLVRRTLLWRVGGFDDRLPRFQDWDLWLRLAFAASFRFVPDPLVRTYFTPGSISTQTDALREAVERLASKFADLPELGRPERAQWFAALGHELVIGGVVAEGRRLFRRSLALRPWLLKTAFKAGLAQLGRRPYTLAVRLWERASLRAPRSPRAAGQRRP